MITQSNDIKLNLDSCAREATFLSLDQMSRRMNPDDFSDFYDLTKKYLEQHVDDWDRRNTEIAAHDEAIRSLQFVASKINESSSKLIIEARIAFHENKKSLLD